MIVDCAVYRDGRRRQSGPLDVTQAFDRRDDGDFVWLGTVDPSPGELDRIRQLFGLHELAVEDAREFHLRPKVGQFEGTPGAGGAVRLIILRTARYDAARKEIDFGEISVFVADDFVITVRQGAASELKSARARLERRPELLRLGTPAVVWAILDTVVDGYAPVIGEVERDIEQLEGTVFSGAVAPTERIYFLRREVSNFYRAVHPLPAVVAAVERTAPDPLAPYLRDVHENLSLVNEEVAAHRDLLSTVLQANIAVISVEQTAIGVQQNATIETLTKLSTIFLPLTFVTGFFGQNFGWLVDHIASPQAFVFYGLGALVLPLIALLSWFRISGGRRAGVIENPAGTASSALSWPSAPTST